MVGVQLMKTTTSHTPGPWLEVTQHHDKDRTEVRNSTGKMTVATCRCPAGVTLEETEANARLIAAAPDLLAALEQAAAQFDYTVRAMALGQTVSISSLQNCAAAARAAIAKAQVT